MKETMYILLGAFLLVGVPSGLGYLMTRDKDSESVTGTWWLDGWIGILFLVVATIFLLVCGSIFYLFGQWVVSLF